MPYMKEITEAVFVQSIKGTSDVLEKCQPQVAFVGRSNVGKSSVINSLTNVKGLAVSSATPGRTRLINLFKINGKRYFVDLPGYGFARMPKKDAAKMQKMLLWYLVDSGIKPKYIVLIVDGSVGPTHLDQEMYRLLHENKHKVIVLANKWDKVKSSQKHKAMKNIKEALGTDAIIAYSSKTKEGREAMLGKVLS